MLRSLCLSFIVAVVLCGCTTDHSPTFKEKYNAYADPQLGSEEFRKQQFPDHVQDYAWKLRNADIPINELENFADAIIRRMDAKTLPEYLGIQDEIDTLYFLLTASTSAKRAYEKYGTPSRQWEVFDAFVRDTILWRFYIIRDEEGIQTMLDTILYYKFYLSFDPDDALKLRLEE